MHKTSTNAVEQTLEAIKNDRPIYAELVELFGPLFRAQSKLAEEIGEGITVPAVDAAKLDQGAHVMALLDLEAWSDELVRCAETLRPIITGILPEDMQGLLSFDIYSDKISLLKLARARLSGDSKAFKNTSKDLNGLPPVLLYMIEASLTPLLTAVRTRLGELIPTEGWEQGSCPMCGSLPAMAWLSPKENHDLEHLVGGGGRKFLHCSLCNHDWHHRRDACPACANEDQTTREVLYAEDNRRERIEGCEKCGTYLVSLDLREYEQPPHLTTAQLGLVHLDIVAKEREYQPLNPSVWNGMEL